MVTWDPADYSRSSSAQLGWAREVIGRLRLSGDEHVLDIGCGDGRVTAEFFASLPSGSVTGIDSSPEMVRHAREAYPDSRYPGLSFHVMDARQITFAGRFHLAFSNAVLHWIEDQPSVLLGVSRALLPGGRFVMSCGGRGNAADFADAVRAVTLRNPWTACFTGFDFPYFFHSPEDYAGWLPEAGLTPVRVELIPKDMVHADREGLAAWMRTTWMPYTQRLPRELQEDFIRETVGEYIRSRPADAEGMTHVGMVRLEVEAVKV